MVSDKTKALYLKARRSEESRGALHKATEEAQLQLRKELRKLGYGRCYGTAVNVYWRPSFGITIHFTEDELHNDELQTILDFFGVETYKLYGKGNGNISIQLKVDLNVIC